MADSSIEDLAVRAQGGDRASFELIVARLRGPLVAFLQRRLPGAHDADDVAQETFDRAYRSLATYDPSRRFSTWLFAIGKNTATNFRVAHRRRAEVEHAIEPAAATHADPTDGAIWQVARRVLGEDAYHGLWLRYACDFTVREVARELGKSVVGTKVMLFRARAKLLEEVD